MNLIQGIDINTDSGEEQLPGFFEDFPYIASCAQLDRYPEPYVPWHWHRTVELFYVQNGIVEYTTPGGTWRFPAGSGGFVNAGILHSSRGVPSGVETVQLLHLFEPELLSGGRDNRIYSRYIYPLACASGIEMIPLFPEHPEEAALLAKVQSAFELDDRAWGYEPELCRRLTDIWMDLIPLAGSLSSDAPDTAAGSSEKLKEMMLYIHAHYSEPICVEQLAAEVHISKRVCFRLFREYLHMSPVEYVTGYRLRKACRRLMETEESVTRIAYGCGFGSSSYFGMLFRKQYGCTPGEYRKIWHDRDNNERDSDRKNRETAL